MWRKNKHLRSYISSNDIKGKDNVVLFYTKRYHDYPLIVQGAGAGSAVTASGIFADILRIADA